MKDETNDVLAKAIADLKRRGASSEPPQEVVNETLAQLARAGSQPEPVAEAAQRPMRRRLWSATRLATAAVVLIAAGYAFGRITAPKPDIEQLRAALLPSLAATLEPAIRARVVEETTREYRLALLAGYVRLRDELTEQYHADLNRFALQTLAASSTATNRLFGRLVEAMNASQLQDRERVAAALTEIKAQQAEDSAALGTALASFAARTETKFRQTEDIMRLWANTQTDTSIPNQDKPDTMN